VDETTVDGYLDIGLDQNGDVMVEAGSMTGMLRGLAAEFRRLHQPASAAMVEGLADRLDSDFILYRTEAAETGARHDRR
jgi:hypothetical protein